MPETKDENSDDMHRIIEVLQSQLASMQTELDEVKSDIKHETKEAEAEPEPEPEGREEVLEYLKKLPGIGLSKASMLYDNGFDSTEKIKEATAEDFQAVPGIGPSMASKLAVSIEQLEKGELELAAPAAEAEPEAGEGGGAMGFIKNTYTKMIGFFKGKKPEGETVVEGESESVGGEESGETPEEESVSVGEEEPSGEAGEDTGETEDKPEGGSEEKPEGDVPEAKEEDKPAEEPEAEESPVPADDDGWVEASSTEKAVEEQPSVDAEEKPAEVEAPPEPDEPKELTKDDILAQYRELEGVSESIATALFEGGYETMDELKEAEEEDLKMIDGVGPKTAESIIKAIKESG